VAKSPAKGTYTSKPEIFITTEHTEHTEDVPRLPKRFQWHPIAFSKGFMHVVNLYAPFPFLPALPKISLIAIDTERLFHLPKTLAFQ
jgi:hypothetical protein